MIATRRATSEMFGRVLQGVLVSVLLTAIQIPLALVSFVGADARTGSTFPIRISRNGRHFEDRDGKPFLVHGDTAWSLVVQLGPDDTAHYLDRSETKLAPPSHQGTKNTGFAVHGEYPTRALTGANSLRVRIPVYLIPLVSLCLGGKKNFGLGRTSGDATHA